jgi:hypothetical protein
MLSACRCLGGWRGTVSELVEDLLGHSMKRLTILVSYLWKFIIEGSCHLLLLVLGDGIISSETISQLISFTLIVTYDFPQLEYKKIESK